MLYYSIVHNIIVCIVYTAVHDTKKPHDHVLMFHIILVYCKFTIDNSG